MALCSGSIAPNNLCRYVRDDICVTCQISGPHPPSPHKPVFHVHACTLYASQSDDMIVSLARSVLEQSVMLAVLPSHCQFGVQLNVLQSESKETTTALLAACLNALCLALVDSGLPMKAIFCAISICPASQPAQQGLLYVLELPTYSIMAFYALGPMLASEQTQSYEAAKGQCAELEHMYRSICSAQ